MNTRTKWQWTKTITRMKTKKNTKCPHCLVDLGSPACRQAGAEQVRNIDNNNNNKDINISIITNSDNDNNNNTWALLFATKLEM